MNRDNENTVEQCVTCMEYKENIQWYEKMIPYEMLYKPWQMAAADIFTIENNRIFFIEDYYSKFPVVKKGRWSFS